MAQFVVAVGYETNWGQMQIICPQGKKSNVFKKLFNNGDFSICITVSCVDMDQVDA